ncbi:MAG: hypothetical protein KAI73_11790 [Rhodospirillaceae bacterium]|nr:hypothetical protein [Rhodospirillaceae bacterium]
MAVRSVPEVSQEGDFRGREHFDNEMVRVMREITSDADIADTSADAAQTSADAAQSTADTAGTAAGDAQTTADAATSDLATHEALAATEIAQAHVKKATAVADVASVDATDLPTALTLVNELKAQVNAMLASDRAAAQRTT